MALAASSLAAALWWVLVLAACEGHATARVAQLNELPPALQREHEPARTLLFDRRRRREGPRWQPSAHIQNELLAAATSAQTPSGSIILTVGNEAAMASYLPVFIEGMRSTQPTPMAPHLVAVTTSPEAQAICTAAHSAAGCVLDDWATSLRGPPPASPPGGGDPRAAVAKHASRAFLAIIWRKPELVRDLVRAGFTVVCMDMDIAVLRNFLDNELLDLSGAVDVLVSRNNDHNNFINSGVIGFRPTERCVKMLNTWASRDVRMRNAEEQIALNRVVKASVPHFGLQLRYIPATTGFTACRHPRRLLEGEMIQEMQRLEQLAPGRLAFVHLACLLRDDAAGRARVMRQVLRTFHGTATAEDAAAGRIAEAASGLPGAGASDAAEALGQTEVSPARLADGSAGELTILTSVE